MKTTKLQTTVKILLGIFLVFAGTGHLSFMRTEFLAQVPNWLPMKPEIVVLLSGVVEIILGLSLIFLPKYAAAFGWAVSIFLVLIFPGNIAQLMNHRDAFGLNSELLRWLRLPFQPFLIILVLWSTGAWVKWRNKINYEKF